jgi:circadian clock protein KaiB
VGTRSNKISALKLRLYIAGNAPNSVRAIANLKAFCADALFDGHEIEIVDLLKDPSRALADGIVVTPTLLKLSPAPALRVIGNLSDTSKLMHSLGAS